MNRVHHTLPSRLLPKLLHGCLHLLSYDLPRTLKTIRSVRPGQGRLSIHFLRLKSRLHQYRAVDKNPQQLLCLGERCSAFLLRTAEQSQDVIPLHSSRDFNLDPKRCMIDDSPLRSGLYNHNTAIIPHTFNSRDSFSYASHIQNTICLHPGQDSRYVRAIEYHARELPSLAGGNDVEFRSSGYCSIDQDLFTAWEGSMFDKRTEERKEGWPAGGGVEGEGGGGERVGRGDDYGHFLAEGSLRG